jgi:succinate-semialdehyde dehydrogenase/glutarate-semialdehyde dehydrogenase
MNAKLNDASLLKNQCYVNGQWITSDTNLNIKVTNPFDFSILAEIPVLSSAQVNHAIVSAHKAFQSWKKTSALEKSKLLMNWYHLIHENINDLAKIMVLEQGKPYKEAIGEIKYAASYIEFYAEEAKRIYGDILPSPFPNSKVFVLKEPVGVVGIITPWNFPIAMMVRKIAPALATGCTCVIKPDEKTPLSAFAIMELAIRAKIPKGVLNMITGIPKEIGGLFTSHFLIKKISFTGSTKVGKLLMKACANQVKRITLELGGNAPFIVFDDANINKAIEGLITAKFRNTGQTCVCANRVFVHESIIKPFVEKLSNKVKNLRIGNGFDQVDIGPLIDSQALEKVLNLINDAREKGATINCGGQIHELGGTFFEPTIISNITEKMAIFETEIFGPVVSIIAFKSEDEVIALANNTKFGLASYFYAKDMSKIWRVAEALEYGMVGVNRGAISSALVPFGGIKESGMGREGSKYGQNDYLNIKYLCISE